MKYFGYYADDRKTKSVNCTLAAVNKMNYIAKVISEIAGRTEIVSAVSPNSGVQEAEEYRLDNNVSVRYFKASRSGNKVLNVLKRNIDSVKFFMWAFRNIKRNEKVVVYHSLGYMNIFRRLKKIRDFTLILEIEEIYADVLEDKKIKAKELNFFQMADAYIFPTTLLGNVINRSNKPEVIIHGTYEVESDRKCKMINNNMQTVLGAVVHCVYAGTLDPRKGGAVAAAAAAEFLPENYHIHILGFGSEAEVQEMKDLITELAPRSAAKVTYDGLLSGEDYVQFIQSCDIGLSTQNPDAAFNGTSFPSKILSYMANGLRVVSVRIPAIESSAIDKYMVYYNEQTPSEIANAIVATTLDDSYDGREIIEKLSNQFSNDMKVLLCEDF